MQTPGEIRKELAPDLDEAEREALVAIAMRLQAERPAPGPAFRGDLRRQLLGGAKTRRSPAFAGPQSARALAATYSAAGLLLLAIAAIGVAGVGPFASA